MQQMGDDESAEARHAMKQKLKKRNTFTKCIGLFVPSIHTQISLNSLCKTDLDNYLNYTEELEKYHEDLRLSFYPKIFDEEPIQNQQWDTYKLKYYRDQRKTDWMSMLPLVLLSLLFLILARHDGKPFFLSII